MLVFINSQFVTEQQATISAFDRGFLFGDGLFETIPVLNAQPFRWDQHLERLQRGADFLHIKLPLTAKALRSAAGLLIRQNAMPDALLRLTLSRGTGPRGYSPKGATSPTLVMSLHPHPAQASLRHKSPPTWKLITASARLPAGEKLAAFKTCNKLPQILARAEAEAAGADEALLLDTDGHAVEGAASNLFWIEHNTICTPPLHGILAGITRAVTLEICRSLKLNSHESTIIPAKLNRKQAVFVTLSSWGIVEASSLDGRDLKRSPLVTRLYQAYQDLLRRETASS